LVYFYISHSHWAEAAGQAEFLKVYLIGQKELNWRILEVAMMNHDRMARNIRIIRLTLFVCALIWLPIGLSLELPRGYVIGSSVGLMVGTGLGYLIFRAMIRSNTGK